MNSQYARSMADEGWTKKAGGSPSRASRFTTKKIEQPRNWDKLVARYMT